MKAKLLSVLALSALLFSCGGNGTSSETPTTSETTSESTSETTSESTSETTSESTSETTSETTSESTSESTNEALAVYDFTTSEESSTLDDTTALDVIAKAVTGSNKLVSVTDVKKVYDGNGAGGAKPNGVGLIKMGTGKADGSMIWTFEEGTNITKVVINCHSFYAASADHPTNSNYIGVNDTFVASPYNETATPEDVEFVLSEATNVITIATNFDGDDSKGGRACLYSVTVYAE